MFNISKKKCLNKFQAVRCLTGKDLFNRLGERIPNDRGFIGSRNPVTLQDMADDIIYDGYSKLHATDEVPCDIPPAVTEPPTE